MWATVMRTTLALMLPGLLAACAKPSIVLLDGERNAKVGAVAVVDETSGEDRALISQANTKARIGDHAVRQKAIDPARLSAKNRALLDGLPEPPANFTLHFQENTTLLVPESESVLQALLAEVARRPGADVQIIGHSDRLGSDANNDRLSLQRAREIREVLLVRGLDPESTRASGRGERDPMVSTADGIREPRNRRVEILVR